MDPEVCLVPAGCRLSNKVTQCIDLLQQLLLSDCAFRVALATTSLDPTIETMIECTTGEDTNLSENLQSSSSVHCTIGAQLFKTPTAPLNPTMNCADGDGLISTSTAPPNLSNFNMNGAFTIDPTTLPTKTISSIVGNEYDETLGKYCFHDYSQR